MRYHNITKRDILNGEGFRSVLWLSGCTHKCPHCQNPQTWDINSGIEFDDKAKQELFESLEDPYCSGITFSGGDPLHPINRAEVGLLILEIKEKFPNKNIWLYTGYTWEEIKNLAGVNRVDVIVDGPFIYDLLDKSLMWKGSSNQRVIDVQKSLAQNKVVLYVGNEKETTCVQNKNCGC